MCSERGKCHSALGSHKHHCSIRTTLPRESVVRLGPAATDVRNTEGNNPVAAHLVPAPIGLVPAAQVVLVDVVQTIYTAQLVASMVGLAAAALSTFRVDSVIATHVLLGVVQRPATAAVVRWSLDVQDITTANPATFRVIRLRSATNMRRRNFLVDDSLTTYL